MGAIFYSYGKNGMLKNSVGPYAEPAKIDFLKGLVSGDNLAIITQVGIQLNETIQFFMTFDDFIHYYWFGKGLGTISLSGFLFGKCDSAEIPGASVLLNKVGQNRGQLTTCSFAGFAFKGVVLDCNITLIAEPETHAAFSINIAMTEHNLQSPPRKAPAC